MNDDQLKIEALLVDVPTALAMLSMKKTKLFELLREGVLVRRKVGRKTLITTQSIKVFAERGAS